MKSTSRSYGLIVPNIPGTTDGGCDFYKPSQNLVNGTTFSSNAIEGNSLTESETKVIIENGLTIEGKPLRDIYEAVGHAKAYDYLYELSHNEPITEEIICNIHRLFYQK